MDIRKRNRILPELGGSLVPVMQPAEARMGANTTGTRTSSSANRRFLAEPEVSPVFVIIAHVLSQEPLQMLFVDGNHMIQQIAPTTLDPAFLHAVLPETCERGSRGSDS